MSNLRNSVRLIGHLGMNPEMKVFEKGTKKVRITLATNEIYTDNEGKKVTETNWHSLVAWGKMAETIEKYFVKGSEVAMEGRLTNHSFDDKEGKKRYVTEVVVNEIALMGKKNAE